MEFQQKFVSCLWALFITYITAIDATIEEVQRHLEMGKQFLSKGQFADALTHYHAAVDLDPENYMTLYRRATVYLATGKSNSAIPDLDRVVTLKPDFTAARLQRGNVLLKKGLLADAESDFKAVLAMDHSNADALEKLNMIGPTREYIESANHHIDANEFVEAEQYLTRALELSPWDATLHEKRALCFEWLGETQKAISDMRATAKLTQDATESFYKISMLYYRLADLEESLNQIRECLKLNPEHKVCFPHYKKIKKMFKQQQNVYASINNEAWDDCLEDIEKLLKTEPNVPALSALMQKDECRCLNKGGHSEEALTICTEVLEIEQFPDIYCERAEAYIALENYDEAIHDYQRAMEVDEGNRRAREGQERAQKLLKQSKRRDYYKILGVRRNANKQQIMKAYRKLAQIYHPDNNAQKSPEEMKKLEQKFIDVASAKEVLTDKEKRARFDNGEDPLDPEQNQGQGFNPFQGGFNPFGGGGGGPFTFKFQYS